MGGGKSLTFSELQNDAINIIPHIIFLSTVTAVPVYSGMAFLLEKNEDK